MSRHTTSKRRIDLWFSENVEVRDGLLRRMRAYDGAAVMRQLGLMPR